MDFHSMKRKELQALCKKHNIPANLTNLEMANNLASLLKEKGKPIIQGRSCLKDMGETGSENDSNEVIRQLKKVRFSPENETIEFVDSRADYVETKRAARRRKSIVKPFAKSGGLVIDSVDTREASREIVENPVRTTRSRAQKSVGGGVIEVVLPVAENEMIDFVDSRTDYEDTKKGGKRKSIMKPMVMRGELVIDSGDNAEASRKIGEKPIRTTRSRSQKSVIGGVIEVVLPVAEKKRKTRNGDVSEGNDGGRGDKSIPAADLSDNLSSESADVEGMGVKTRRSLRKKEVLISEKTEEVEKDFAVLRKDETSSKRKNVETNDGISKGTGLDELRRSKRTVRKVEDYGLLNSGLVDNDKAGKGRNARSQTLIVDDISAPERDMRPETEVQVRGKLEVVLQLEEPSRRRGRMGTKRQSAMPQIEKVGNDGAKADNESRNLRRRPVSEVGSRHEDLRETDIGLWVAISDAPERNAKKIVKDKPLKRRGDPNIEETVVTEGAAFVGEPAPRRSRRNASKTDTAALAVGTGKAVRGKRLQSRTKIPNLEVEPLTESTLVVKEPPSFDAQVSEVEIAESTVLNSRKPRSDSATKNGKEFSEESPSKEVSVETSDIKEDKALETSNLVEVGVSESTKLQNDHAEMEALVSVSSSKVDEEKSDQDDTSMVNEDDLAYHTCKRSTEFDSNTMVDPEPEPEEDLNVSVDVDFPQTTIGDDGNLIVDLTDCMAVPSLDNLDIEKEMERDEEVETTECIDSSCVVARHGVDDDKASVVEEPDLVELEDGDNVGEPTKPEFVVGEDLAESNVSGETDEAGTQETATCSLGMENRETETPLTKNISPSRGPQIADPELSELEVAEGTNNPALSSTENVSGDTNIRVKGSSGDSRLKKQHQLMEACTEGTDLDEIRGLMMINFEGTSPASNSVKLQSHSEDQERNIPGNEFLVVTEKENMSLVDAKQNLFLGEMHKGNEYDLASPSQIQIGDFEDHENVGNVGATGTTFGADGFSPFHQAENVVAAKPSGISTFSGHLGTVRRVSSECTQSQGVIDIDYPVEDGKCSVPEVQNLMEFQEDCSLAIQNTQEMVCEGHSTGPDESGSAGQDCENTSENAVVIRTLDPSNGERNTPNMVEQNNSEAEFSLGSGKSQKTMSLSNTATAQVVSEEITNFQNTSGYCSMGKQPIPVNSPECKVSPTGDQLVNSTGSALSIANAARKHDSHMESTQIHHFVGNTNLVEVEENSKHDNEFHHGIVSNSYTFASDMGDEICHQEKIEALAEKETMPAGSFSVERASHPVDEGSTGFETYSINDSTKTNESSMSMFTDEERVLSVEMDTDQAQDTLAPIITPESSLVANNELTSSPQRTPSKDDNESVQEDEFRTLFATPANYQSPSEEAASSHETEIDDARMQDGSTICTVKNGSLSHGEPGEVLGLSEDKAENMAHERNASPPATAEVTSECCDGTADVEFTREDGSRDTALGWFFGKDDHVREDEETDGRKLCGNASKEDTNIKMHQLIFEAGITTITSQSDIDESEFSVEAAEGNESIAKSHATGADTDCQCTDAKTHATRDLEYQASVSELRLSVDSEMQDEGMRSSPNDFADAPVIPFATVTEAKDNCEAIEGDLDLECSKLATEEENVECFPEVEDLVAQTSGRRDVDLADTPCHKRKVSEEKIMAELTKSTSKYISGTHLLKGGENEGALAPFDQVGISKMVFDEGVEFAIRDANGLVASDILSNKDDEEKVILEVKEAAFAHVVSEVVLPEDTNVVMLEHNEEVVVELKKHTSTDLEKLTNRKEHEDLIEVLNTLEGAVSHVDEVKFNDFARHKGQVVQELEKGSFVSSYEFVSADYEHGEDESSADVAGPTLQVKEMTLDDLDSNKDRAIMEGDLNIIDKSYAEEDVSPESFDHCSENEKVPKKASCTQLNVSDSDGRDSETNVLQGDLGSDAEGREATDCVFTVSSLVPIDGHEDRGNTPTCKDKSFEKDKDVGKEKVVGEMIDNYVSYGTDGSNIEENVKSDQKVSEEQLGGDDDAQVAYHGTMGYETTDLSLESTMFSSWEINLLLGDEVLNSTSEISETPSTHEDIAVTSLLKQNANFIVPEEQFGKHNQLMEGKVAEPIDSVLVTDESAFEVDEVLKERDLASENDSVEVEKSSMHKTDVILTEVFETKGGELATSVDLRVEGDLKSSEPERVGEATELRQNALQSADLAIDGGATVEESRIWESELVKGNSAVRLLNSAAMKRKNAETSWIQATPKKLITSLDMKENAPSIKRENFGGTTVRSTTKRRALEDLQNQ